MGDAIQILHEEVAADVEGLLGECFSVVWGAWGFGEVDRRGGGSDEGCAVLTV